jgi:hypothetical protein
MGSEFSRKWLRLGVCLVRGNIDCGNATSKQSQSRQSQLASLVHNRCHRVEPNTTKRI